jgi:hypothetical protein
MATILAQKDQEKNPQARSDTHYDALANDPEVSEFVKGTSYDSLMAKLDKIQSAPAAPPPVLTNAGDNAAQNAEVLVKNTNEDFINKKWRPMTAWVYLVTCSFDFIVAPILWSIVQVLGQGQVSSQWQPLTLQGAGLYHIAMGAVLGIATYGRTKEKIEGKHN